MKACPSCARELADKAVACNACGYEFPVRGANADPDRLRCSHVLNGVRCKNKGSLSVAGAPFVCSGHAPGRRELKRMAIPESFYQTKAALKPKPYDFEAVIERAGIQGEA